MRVWMQIATAFLLSSQAYAQIGSAKFVAAIDLKRLGVKVPAKGSVSATALELLFLSDSYLALLKENDRLGEPRDAHLTLYEIGEGIVRPKKTIELDEAVMPISPSGARPEKVLEWIDSQHFVYWTYSGRASRWLCDTDLNCREDKEGIAPVTLPHAANCRSGDLLGFTDTQRAVCLVPRWGTKWSAIVMDSSGHHLYEVAKQAFPWDTRLVSSSQGQGFGLEWKSNTRFQLLNPFACIDECPPAGKQQFVVFNSNDGRILQGFDWDPRPYNLDALPALSPSGKTSAFVRTDSVVIYSLDGMR